MEEINYLLIAAAALVAVASPGPATLAIMATSMSKGRIYGATIAAGILTGGLMWSVAAAFGLGAIMHANAWLFEVLRYIGAMYLLYLSYRSLRSVFTASELKTQVVEATSYGSVYLRGLLIHLTNPKAILFFGALYSLAIPAGTNAAGLVSVILFVATISASIFFGYAFIFSSEAVRNWYVRSQRMFNFAFGALFGFAGIRLLVTRLHG